jgi:RNA polymerase sigma-70 factor (ECF subfamily)
VLRLDKLDEIAAIRRCQAGDKEAFRALAVAHERTLFGIAFLMTRDRDRSSEAVQETLLKMWNHLPSFRGDHLKPWLSRILVNEVKQQGRRKKAQAVPIEAVSEQIAAGEDVENDAERDELLETVRRAVGSLPDQQREAVIMRYFAGLTLAEVAVAARCRVGTVKSRRAVPWTVLSVFLTAQASGR